MRQLNECCQPVTRSQFSDILSDNQLVSFVARHTVWYGHIVSTWFIYVLLLLSMGYLETGLSVTPTCISKFVEAGLDMCQVYALSFSSLSLSSWTSMHRRRTTVPVATPGEWA